mmetsp:Transcript_30884/g.47107  ORF Transcript_30884/g.47107 Transcript_30884/m.47107 type:complete len:238 (-) Transcript_30884:28-741(-)
MVSTTSQVLRFLVCWWICCITTAFIPSLHQPSLSLSSSFSSQRFMIGQLFDDMVASFQSNSNNSKKKVVQELKESIRSLSQGTNNGLSATDGQRTEIASLVKELEQYNPTKKLSSNDKLNGSWTLIYTTNQGSSAGKLGPFVGEVEQAIELPDDYINYVRLPFLEGALTATWDVLADNKWQVNFQTLEFKLLGIPVIQTKLEAQGIWRKTYLDEDFRILYAIGGKNTETENIYILAK